MKAENMISKFGNWIFHYRNFLFFFLYAGVFVPSPDITNSSITAIVVGLLFIFSGMAVRGITIGLEYIERGGIKRKINANKLVKGGIYSICRNPMYLGNLLILFGFGIYANSSFFTLIIFTVFVFIYYSIIKAEEQFLTRRFGQEYIDYKQKVHAVLPSLRLVKTAFGYQKFNWGKMILKEYNSLYVYFSGMLIIAFFQETISTSIFVSGFILVTTIFLVVKFIKYQKRATLKTNVSKVQEGQT